MFVINKRIKLLTEININSISKSDVKGIDSFKLFGVTLTISEHPKLKILWCSH